MPLLLALVALGVIAVRDSLVEALQDRGVRLELSEALTEAARTRDKLGRLLDAHMVGAIDTCRVGHPMTEYDTYTFTGGDGRTRRYCRECRRERQTELRRKNEKAPTL